MRAVVAILTMFVLAFPCGAAAQTAMRPDTVIHLFDGKSMDGFYTWLVDSHREDPLRVFTRRGPGGRRAGDPHQRREVGRHRHARVVPRLPPDRGVPVGAADLGRSGGTPRATAACSCTREGADGNTGRDFNGPWMRSIEAQIIEGGVGDIILVAGFEADGTRRTPTHHRAGGRRTATARPSSTRTAAPRMFDDRPHQLVRPRSRLAATRSASAARPGRREPARGVDAPRGPCRRATASPTS